MTTADLSPDEYHDYYAGYIRQVPSGLDIDAALVDSLGQLDAWLARVPESRAGYAYAPDKWTVAQCLQHVIDSGASSPTGRWCSGEGMPGRCRASTKMNS